MASLYNIEQELVDLFATIEENDGEITEEQENNLIIKKDELVSKLDSYYKAIKTWESDFDCCKKEKKRINDVQKKYENRITRLKDAILTAVVNFGDAGKNNRFIECPTVRFYTSSSYSVNIDESRLDILLAELNRYIVELVLQGCLYTDEDVDIQGLLDSINANIIAERGNDFTPFTISDLHAITVNVTTTDTIANLFKKHENALLELGTNMFTTTLTPNIDKDKLKREIACCENNDKIPLITIANVVKNENLRIK